jgi:hypothetical protein
MDEYDTYDRMEDEALQRLRDADAMSDEETDEEPFIRPRSARQTQQMEPGARSAQRS